MPGTEAPTPRRLRRALELGDTAISPFATSVSVLLVALAAAPSTVTALASRFEERLERALQAPKADAFPTEFADAVVGILLPVSLGGAAAALLVGLLQKGRLGFRRLPAGPGRLSLSALFPPTAGFDMGRTVIAVLLVASACVACLSGAAPSIAATGEASEHAPLVALAVASRLGVTVAIPFTLLAFLDFAVRRQSLLERLRMTPHELRQEQRETSGDPLVRGSLRRTHEALLNEVPTESSEAALFVVTDGKGVAVTLLYDAAQKTAPVVVSGGEHRGAPAHVVVDAPLAGYLATVPEGNAIPNAYYARVANAFARALSGR